VIAARARTLSIVATISAMLAGAPRARADDLATAQALFEAARVAIAHGDYGGACPKFAESQRLDPAPGTLLNLADCEEHLGHLARAWDAWHEGIALLPRGDERLAPARQRAQALESRLPRLLIRLAPGVPPATKLQCDSTEIGTASLGVPLPVDPGPHLVRAAAAGFAPSTTNVTLAEGETRTIDVTLGPPLPAAPEAPPPSVSTPAPSTAPPPARAVGGTRSGGGLRVVGWIVGGVGVAGVGVGAATGILTMSRKATVDVHCSAAKGCDQTGYDAAQSGKTLAVESNVFFAAGAVLLATGVSLVLIGGSHVNPTALFFAPSPGGHGASFGLQRDF
jgi:hypothetical protein